jgi:peptidoglycan/xylan/chitin deacetylase (PgdA/CDA1 family)
VVDGAGGQPSGTAGDGSGASTGNLQGECDPTGATAMVSLTYDDALPSQMVNAVPALEAHELTATFFLTNVTIGQSTWGALKQKGHELGAHTLVHPCPKADWVAPGNSSQEFDLARMEEELDGNIEQLKAMGQAEPFTFAYPCGVDWVGDPQESYVDLVKARFSAARGVVPGVITALTDEYHVPSSFLTGTADSLKALVDQAKAKKGWVVFGFHGVGGDHSMVQTADHEALLAYLEEQGSDVRVLPFGPAVECMKSR